MMKGSGRVSTRFLVSFNLIYLGVNYLWISFESLVLPIQIGNILPESQMGFALGIIAAIGSGSGIAGNLLSGYLGDHFRMGRGKRSPYIAVGIIMATIAVSLDLALSFSIYYILAVYVMLQAFSNVAIGSVQPIIAEIVSSSQRGTSAGLNGLFTLVGSALGFSATGFLLSYYSAAVALYSIIAGLLITGIVAFVSVRGMETKIQGESRGPQINVTNIVHLAQDFREFRWLIAGSFLVFMGATGLTYFELYFFKQVLNAAKPELYVAVAGTVILAISAFASITLGHFSYRLGRWRILVVTAAFSAVPMILIPFFSSFYVFLILGAFIGAAYGVFYSVSAALAGDLVPKAEAGKYMSFFNLALAGASTISPAIYGTLLFIFRMSVHDGYVALFSTSSSFFIIGSAAIFNARRRTEARTVG